MLHVAINSRDFFLQRPSDLESMWERMADQDLDPDEHIPYWVELWPASIVLAQWLVAQEKRIAGHRCLDLGCGLGLCTQAAASCQARVVGTDYEVQALHFAQEGAGTNQPWTWLGMDWRCPCFKPKSFPFIFGADILYESRFFAPIIDLWANLLAPGGKIWITDPEREVSRPFWSDILPRKGLRANCVLQEKVSYQSYQNMQISLWEVSFGSGKSAISLGPKRPENVLEESSSIWSGFPPARK
jgi:predicted nicotinamide N-methyase